MTRDDMEEAIWRVCGRASWQEVERLLRVIDTYAFGVARKLTRQETDHYASLKPGETDPETLMRRCKRCGEVKHISLYGYDHRQPYRRRRSCEICSPSRRKERPKQINGSRR